MRDTNHVVAGISQYSVDLSIESGTRLHLTVVEGDCILEIEGTLKAIESDNLEILGLGIILHIAQAFVEKEYLGLRLEDWVVQKKLVLARGINDCQMSQEEKDDLVNWDELEINNLITLEMKYFFIIGELQGLNDLCLRHIC